MIACDHRMRSSPSFHKRHSRARYGLNNVKTRTTSHVSDERAPRSEEPGLLAYAVASADGATVLEAREGSSDVCLILLGNDHPARERGGNERQAGVGGEEDVRRREVLQVVGDRRRAALGAQRAAVTATA